MFALTAGVKTRDDVLNMGIGAYNEECRSIVSRCPSKVAASLNDKPACPKVPWMSEITSDPVLSVHRPFSPLRYSKEWEKTVHRLGRWIDFEKGYRTMDPSFMESVWWVMKQLFDKGLIYKGFKVSHE